MSITALGNAEVPAHAAGTIVEDGFSPGVKKGEVALHQLRAAAGDG
jgi:hypothetical protein